MGWGRGAARLALRGSSFIFFIFDWKSLELIGNHWKSLEIIGNHWKRPESGDIVAAAATFWRVGKVDHVPLRRYVSAERAL